MTIEEFESLQQQYITVAQLTNRIKELERLRERGDFRNQYVIHLRKDDGFPDEQFLFQYHDMEYLLPAIDRMIDFISARLYAAMTELGWALSRYPTYGDKTDVPTEPIKPE